MGLWSNNAPKIFWKFSKEFSSQEWDEAVMKAVPVLELSMTSKTISIDEILRLVLGEEQFGPDQWQLSQTKRLYYAFKPFIPRGMTRVMRRIYSSRTKQEFLLHWPIEDRYIRFLREVASQLMCASQLTDLSFVYFWPNGCRYAFVLTHDVETAKGQAFVNRVADLEEGLGFRSCFNFVPERYPVDRQLLASLRERGFEVGIHGLKHDGKLFLDRKTFSYRAKKINDYLKDFGAIGFRSPLTHRNPEWMQELAIDYDSSFFDSDPYEPIPGGVETIWPFEIGHFIELPYTLVQDYSLMNLLNEKSPQIWLEKIEFLEKYNGMALLNTHPDYLLIPEYWEIYKLFLEEMKKRQVYWHALPRDVAAWWRKRANANIIAELPDAVGAKILLDGKEVVVEVNSEQPRRI